MLRRRLYYAIKPFVSPRLRLAARRMSATRTRARHHDTWPILAVAARRPGSWPGWPAGKDFAFVLTHDVEGPAGLAKCERLAALEASLGFRSSFNLIPEGSYRVQDPLREALQALGCEVGVHDLHHDGKLYHSRASFQRSAHRINGYLKAWGATGFRSGFMLHELDWIHDLEVEYDCSTFDTDPYEPQPEGAGTIFPFWVPPPADQPNRPGYVELPYTLAQDSTLFLVLRERSPEVWLRKLDWLVEKGGMALVNVHPDYLQFADEPANDRTFPVEHYVALLEYVRDRHAGRYWQPLPRELARWFKQVSQPAAVSAAPPAGAAAGRVAAPPANLRGKRAAVLLYSDYPADTRPLRAARAMVDAGMEVDLLCLSLRPDDPRYELIDGVRVHRLPLIHSRGRKSAYLWNYFRFFVRSLLWLARASWRRRYDIVHVHNMPDFLVFAAIVPRLRGAKVILDLHDPMPELMMAIFGLPENRRAIRLLRRIEKYSIAFADLVITTNLSFKNLFAARNRRSRNIQIVMNSPEEAIFHDRVSADGARAADSFRIVHHGLIAHRHGIDLLIRAVAEIRPRLPGVRLSIYGGANDYLDRVLTEAAALGVSDVVTYHGNKTQEEIARAIADCHLGVIPNRRNPFTDINLPTRIFEYLAVGRPVIAPATRGIKDYFTDDDLIFFDPDDPPSLASKLLWAHEHPEAVAELVRRGQAVYRRHLWSGERARFLTLLGQLQAGVPISA